MWFVGSSETISQGCEGLSGFDVLWLKSHADEAAEEASDAWDVEEDAEQEWDLDRSGAAQHAVENAVCGDLEALRVADGALAAVLHGEQVMHGGCACEQRPVEAVGGMCAVEGPGWRV